LFPADDIAMRVTAAFTVSPLRESPLTSQAKATIDRAAKHTSSHGPYVTLFHLNIGQIATSKVPRAVHGAERQYIQNSKGYGFGDPEVRKAVLPSGTIYIVSGILSDTGNEVKVFSDRGELLATGYQGQGSSNAISWE